MGFDTFRMATSGTRPLSQYGPRSWPAPDLSLFPPTHTESCTSAQKRLRCPESVFACCVSWPSNQPEAR